MKVKELTVWPGKKLSLQRHENRSERWMVSVGVATVKLGVYHDDLMEYTLKVLNTIEIPANRWHQLINNTNEALKILEIQYGNECVEEDIERCL